MKLWQIASFLGLAAASHAVLAIECWRAKTPTETAICSNPALKAYDEFLDRAYAAVRQVVPAEVFAEVRRDQIRWIRDRDSKCGADVTCLMQEAQIRAAALNGFAQRYAEKVKLGQTQTPTDVPTTVPSSPTAPLDPTDIYRRASQSVVVVMGFNRERGSLSQGSGVVIAPDTVATNCHVLEAAEAATVFFRDRRYSVQAVSGDRKLDFCILRTLGLPARTADTASISTVAPGQRVYSVGSPHGLELTIAEGLVSGLRRREGVPLPLIQTSAAISPGSSGGALLDQFGRVIGITTFHLQDSQNINFALPVELSRTIR